MYWENIASDAMDSPVTEADDTGVSAALEKIISLESRLRQAIQNSHPLSSSFDRDAASADREREALLAVGYAKNIFPNRLTMTSFSLGKYNIG